MSDPRNYTVGWICAILPEFVAAQEFLDEEHEGPSHVASGDNNTYFLGRIHKHNIAIAALPDGRYGISTATAVAISMLNSFPNIRIGLMVGIAGGAPTADDDIRLGDIVVSAPRGDHGGVFQYDFGKTIQGQEFHYTKHLDKPPTAVLTAISSLRAKHERRGHNIAAAVKERVEKLKQRKAYSRPDAATDVLYRSEIIHAENERLCATACGTSTAEVVPRNPRDEDEDDPAIHYGLVASADQLMKDATVRDRLASEKRVLCFEMEAAGLMDNFPCLVVRGICDYSDTHKNKAWQGYAAMTAAAYARELLYCVSPSQLEFEKTVSEAISSVQHDVHEIKQTVTSNKETAEDNEIMKWLNATHPSNKRNEVEQRRHPGSGGWLMNDTRYKTWKSTPGSFLWLSGMAGCGKTFLSSAVVDDMQRSGLRVIYFYFQFDDNTRQKVDHILRSLIFQSYWMTDKAKAHIKKMSQHCNGYAQPTVNQLYDCLVSILNEDEYWVIVDALDECPDRQGSHTEGVLQFIKSLREDTEEHTHVLVTSRAEQDIRDSISQWATEADALQLNQGLVGQDIQSYVTHQLATREGFKRWHGRPDVVQEIKDTILNKADGMFRWVACQLDSLEQCLDPRSLKTALKSLPTGLDETYSRMIDAIPEERKSTAINILRILIFSDTPPSIEELADALAIDVTEEPTPRFDRDLRMPNPMEITSYCPSMIITHTNKVLVDDPSEWSLRHHWKEITEVHLAHFSVKEFLTSDRLSDELKDCMGADASRAYLTTICVTYLAGIQYKMSKEEILKNFPFAKSSAKAWWEHAAGRRQVKNKKIDDLIVNFLLFNNEAYLNSLRLQIPETSAKRRTMMYRGPPAWGLYYACEYGMAMDVENLLRHSPNVNVFGGVGGYPIHAAAGKGHAKLVQRLLSEGARVDLRTIDGLTPLHFAAESGDEETVQYLLNANADIYAIGKKNETVLTSACFGGNLSMVKRFVKLGVDISGRFGVAALKKACSYGYEGIVQFLIDLGIDPYTCVANFGLPTSPIGQAAQKGHAGVVQVCLRVKPSDTITMTSDILDFLLQASLNGHNHIVRMILDARQDVGALEQKSLVLPKAKLNLPEGLLNRILMIAFCGGSREMIFLLLYSGADVNYVETHGTTCIDFLLRRDLPEACLICLRIGYKVNLTSRKNGNIHREYCDGCPGLAAACDMGYEGLARIFLQRGADVNTRVNSEYSSNPDLYRGYVGPVLGYAVRRNYTGIVQLLVEFGADTKLEPLMAVYHESANYAYKHDEWSRLKLLVDLGADLHGPVRTACFQNRIADIERLHGWGVMVGKGLLEACQGGHLTLVQRLLELGADPDTENIRCDICDKFKKKPTQCHDSLLAASYGGHVDIVQLLLDRGASVNRREASSINTPPTTAASHSEAAHDISDIEYGKALQEVVERHEGIRYPNDVMLGDFADALQAASYQGHEDVIRVLIAKGVDVNSTGGILGSAIAAASLSGQCGSVRLLLAAGADAGASDGRALVAALAGGHEEIVSLLCGPEVDLTGEQREMAFWEAIEIGNELCTEYVLDNIHSFPVQSGVDVLEESVFCQNTAVVREMLKKGSNVWNSRTHTIGNPIAASMIDEGSWYIKGHFNALDIAIWDRNVAIVRLLLKWSVDFTSPACRQAYLLKATESKFPIELTEAELASDTFGEGEATSSETISILLLEHGIDLNWPQENYDHALIQSAKMGFAELIQVLLARGASYNDVKEWPLTTLQLALDKGDNDFIRASNNSGAKIVDHSKGNYRPAMNGTSLSSERYSVGEPDSTLLYAAADGRAEAVTICMSTASVMQFSNCKGVTALHFAAVHGHAEVIRTLLDINSSPPWARLYINAVMEEGRTALHLAAEYGHHKCIRVLLENGANPTISAGWRGSPLEQSKQGARNIEDFERYTACIELLENWKDAPSKDPHQEPAADKEDKASLVSSTSTVEEGNAGAHT